LFSVGPFETLGLEECLLTNLERRVTTVECVTAEATVMVIRKEELLKRFNNQKLREQLFEVSKNKIHFITSRIKDSAEVEIGRAVEDISAKKREFGQQMVEYLLEKQQ